MHYDEETQGLMQKNGKNPQDPIPGYGKQIASYSDWSSYDKPETKKQDDGGSGKQRILLVLLLCGLIFGVYYVSQQHLLKQQLQITQQDTSVVKQTTTNINGNYSQSALEDVFKKINDGLNGKKEQTQAPLKVIDDNETIDQVLQKYIQKAQQSDDVDQEDQSDDFGRFVDQDDSDESQNTESVNPKIMTLDDLAIPSDDEDVIQDEDAAQDEDVAQDEKEQRTQLSDLSKIVLDDEPLMEKQDVEETPDEQNSYLMIPIDEAFIDDLPSDDIEEDQVPTKPEDAVVQVFESNKGLMDENYDTALDKLAKVNNEIVIPKSSEQKVRLLTLPNQIKVLLLQEEEDSEYVELALSIRTGSWDDPKNKPGLTNLMQHMFLEGMPVTNYHSFFECTQHLGGFSEGFTEDTYTNYQLEFQDIANFHDVLRQFLNLLAWPRLTMDRVIQQSKEIEGEDTLTLAGDSLRVPEIFGILSKPNHPVKQSEPFWLTKPIEDVDQIITNFVDHFSSNLVTVVIRSNGELDSLQNLVMKSDLKKFVNFNKEVNEYDPNDLPLQSQNILFKFRTSSHDFGQKLLVQLPSNEYSDFVRFILMQNDEGSLGYVLNTAKFTSDAKVRLDVYTFADTYHLATVSFNLASTIEELPKVFQVTHVFNSYVSFLASQEDSKLEELYQSFLKFQDLKFNFDSPLEDNILFLAKRLHQTDQPFEPVTADFDAKRFKAYLSYYTQNFRILIGRKDFVYQPSSFPKRDNLEFLMQTSIQQRNDEYRLDYAMTTIQQEQMQKITASDQSIIKQFKLPQIGDLLPSSFDVQSLCDAIGESDQNSSNNQTRPQQNISQEYSNSQFQKIFESNEAPSTDPIMKPVPFTMQVNIPEEFYERNGQCYIKELIALQNPVPFNVAPSVWWKPAQHRKAPQVFVGLHIQRSDDLSGVKSKSVSKMHQRYLQEVLRENLGTQAQQLDHEVLVENTINGGLNIQVITWVDTMSAFLSRVASIVQRPIEITLFNRVKASLIQEIRGFYNQRLQIITLQYHLPQIMLRPIHTPEEVLQTLDHLQFKEFFDYTNQLHEQTHNVQVALIGPLSVKQAQEQGQKILQDFNVDVTTTQSLWTKTLDLTGHSIVYPIRSPSEDSSIINFYQYGMRDVKALIKLELLSAYLQLGEIDMNVQFKVRSVGCVDGLGVYGQSTNTSPKEMNQVIESFLLDQEKSLLEVTDAEFDTFKYEVLKKIQHDQKFKSIKEEGQFIWERLHNDNFMFEDVQQTEQIIQNLTRAEFVLFYDDFFKGKSNGKMSVHVYGSKVQDNLKVSKEEEFRIVALDSQTDLNDGMSTHPEKVVFSVEEVVQVDKNYFECFYNLNR